MEGGREGPTEEGLLSPGASNFAAGGFRGRVRREEEEEGEGDPF